MPYPFSLPTTSILSFSLYFSSPTHPSLPHCATTARSVVRSSLKSFRRSSTKEQYQQLAGLSTAIQNYLAYLLALDAGLSDRAVNGEELDILLEKEVRVEWRSCIAASVIPGRSPPRTKGTGLDYEILMLLSTLACVHVLQAKHALRGLYNAVLPTSEQRLQIITSSSKALLTAQGIHAHLHHRATSSLDGVASPHAENPIPEADPSTQIALAALAHAEASLLAVLKDDPYSAQILQERNKSDREWMIKAPELPKVRAHLFARLCLGAAEQASKAEALLKGVKGVDEELIRYCGNLRRSSRAKACRFFGIDADLGGETGKGVAWLNGGERELGVASASSGSNDGDGGTSGISRTVFRKIRHDWQERREDKKIASNDEDWGRDAGMLEEGRVIAMLKAKWTKMNDKMNTQTVPPCEPLLANEMPSGREIPTKGWESPVLDEEILTRMRAPPNEEDCGVEDSDSGAEEGSGVRREEQLPGTFPGVRGGEHDYY